MLVSQYPNVIYFFRQLYILIINITLITLIILIILTLIILILIFIILILIDIITTMLVRRGRAVWWWPSSRLALEFPSIWSVPIYIYIINLSLSTHCYHHC